MQSTIYYLQTQLREAKEQIAQLQKEKLEHSGASNGFPSNHLSNDATSNCKSPPLQMTIVENSHPTITSAEESIDLNGSNDTAVLKIKQEMDTSEPLTPTPVTEEIETVEPVLNMVVVKQEPIELPETVPVAIVQSVIVENKNSINHDKQIPFVERTNLFVDATEKTNDQTPDVDKSVEKDDADTVVAQNAVKNIKRTPESGRGRKRTRPRTPVETEVDKEDNLPLRKRTRRREAEARQEAIEENRTSVEIDTDTEVAVAQTLASWARTKQESLDTKQERTEVKVDESSLGNGELKIDTEAK